MKCEVCGRSPGTDSSITLFRQNEKGVPGIWRCEEHSKPVEQDLAQAVAEIQHCLGAKKNS